MPRKSGAEEPIEARRHRMRVAQRKHRARKEQTIEKLEGELEAAKAKLVGLQDAFQVFEQGYEHATEERDWVSCHNLQPLVQCLRAAVGAGSERADRNTTQIASKHGSASNYDFAYGQKQYIPFLSEVDETDSDVPGVFAARLYQHCIKLVYTLLCSKHGPYKRLGRRKFHQYMLHMDCPSEIDRLDLIKDFLMQRVAYMASNADPRSWKKVWSRLHMPRIPGFAHYLDVAQVETLMVQKGFRFSDDLSTAYVAVTVDTFPATPDLEHEVHSLDSPQASFDDAQSDVPLFDDQSWFDIDMFVEPSNTMDIGEYTRYPEDDQTHQFSDPGLPFGLFEKGDSYSVELPGFGRLKECLSPHDKEILNSNQHNGNDEHGHSFLEGEPIRRTMALSIPDLMRRLAIISVCIGPMGPGYRQEDVMEILADMMHMT